MEGQAEGQDKYEDITLFEKVLDEYESNLGIDKIEYNEEVDEYLNLKAEQIEGMSLEDCDIAQFLLSAYACYLQKEQNRQDIRVEWANQKINRIISDYAFQNTYVKHDILRAKIAKENSAVKALMNIVKHAKSRSTLLSFLSGKVTLMSKAIQNAKETRLKTGRS